MAKRRRIKTTTTPKARARRAATDGGVARRLADVPRPAPPAVRPRAKAPATTPAERASVPVQTTRLTPKRRVAEEILARLRVSEADREEVRAGLLRATKAQLEAMLRSIPGKPEAEPKPEAVAKPRRKTAVERNESAGTVACCEIDGEEVPCLVVRQTTRGTYQVRLRGKRGHWLKAVRSVAANAVKLGG